MLETIAVIAACVFTVALMVAAPVLFGVVLFVVVAIAWMTSFH